MKKAALILLFAALSLSIVLSAGCVSIRSQKAKYQTNLDAMLAAKWQSYGAEKVNWGGGLAMYVISPKGSFFAVADLPGAGENIH